MGEDKPSLALAAAKRGIAALARREHNEARRWAHRALELDPECEKGWLLLAALTPPESRRPYLQHVLQIHPKSSRARLALAELDDGFRAGASSGAAPRPVSVASERVRRASVADSSRSQETPRPASLIGRDFSPLAWVKPVGSRVLWRVAAMLGTIMAIAYLTVFGLILYERGREGLPADPVRSAATALVRTATYLVDHPETYRWHRADLPALNLVAQTFGNSAGLLLVSLSIAIALGIPLGATLAMTRRRVGASALVLLSVLGVSTPSFLLAMLLWVINIQVHNWLGVPVLPSAGFGWDAHMLMPALVLSARPLAQLAQVTYVTLSDVLQKDYIRTARAKGLYPRILNTRHALRNTWIPILTTLGVSMRFSLASLPVVEYFFAWPGVGLVLLEALTLGMTPLVTDLILSLGLLFLLVNLLLDWLYPIADPRLRAEQQEERRDLRPGLRERLNELASDLASLWKDLHHWAFQTPAAGPTLPPLVIETAGTGDEPRSEGPLSRPRSRKWRAGILENPALVVGGVMVVAMLGLALFGERLTAASAYEVHGVMMVEGTIGAPPFRPSSVFPWGTDHLGRDVQALVLAGARQTLGLAVLGTLARVILGTFLGMVAGWTRGGWLDRVITSAIGVWAAFPLTLFAMILIFAVGIEQGMWVFVLALCVVGWGEVAQFVRGKVIETKGQMFIEAARSIGARSAHILKNHVAPNLIPSIVVIAILEMGGVLMLLADLGFLNVFLGGGFKIMIAEVGRMVPVIPHFSDVPEWSALLANIREWWRSYPWMAVYPGAAFFLAIMAFNLWGEGIRRLFEQGRFNMSRLINRASLIAVCGLVIVLPWLLRSSAPMGVYRSQAKQFDAASAMEDVRILASPEMEGRETGSFGAGLAAQYIAVRMQAIGLKPGGEDNTYIQSIPTTNFHLTGAPRLEVLNGDGSVAKELSYRVQFVENTANQDYRGLGQGAVVGLALPPGPYTSDQPSFSVQNEDVYDKIVLLNENQMPAAKIWGAAGVLLVSDDPDRLSKRYIFPKWSPRSSRPLPVLVITPEVADELLATASSSLSQLHEQAAALQPGEGRLTAPGATVRVEVPAEWSYEAGGEWYYNVIGYIPGTGSETSVVDGRGMDSHVIMVSAYSDGAGTAPDGTLYPGANDNGSGVAAMLELARALKSSPYQPKRTVVFVAWAGGERGQGLSVDTIMNAKLGFNSLTVDAVIELSGVAAGRGEAIALGRESSFRLVQLFQDAASQIGASTTTRGRGPNYGIPIEAGFGDTAALMISVSWDGSDQIAHTPDDSFELLDSRKLQETGETTLLALTVLSREPIY